MTKETLAKDMDKFVLRLPNGMRDRLKEIAVSNGRSLNAEIVERLDRSLKAWPRIDLPPPLYDRAINAPIGLIMPLEQEINDLVVDIVERRVPKAPLTGLDFFAELEQIIAQEPNEAARQSMQSGLDRIRRSWESRVNEPDE